MTKLVKLFKRHSIFFILMLLAAFTAFIRTACYATLLSPKLMGYLAIATTVSFYAAYFQFGLVSGLERELPVLLGAKRQQQVRSLLGQSMRIIILLQLVVLLVAYCILQYIHFDDNNKHYAILLGIVLGLSTPYLQIILLRFRAEQRSISFAVAKLSSSLLVLVLGLLAIMLLGYQGAIYAAVVVNIGLYIISARLFFQPTIFKGYQIKKLSYLIKIGLPMTLASILLNTQFNLDKIFIATSQSAHNMGLYQIATLPVIAGTMLNSIVNSYLSPKMLYEHGKGISNAKIFNTTFITSLTIALIMLVCWPVFSILIKFIFKHWLPAYIPSLQLINIFYFSAIFISSEQTSLIFNVTNKQIVIFYVTLLITLAALSGYLAIQHYALTLKWYAYANVTIQLSSWLITTLVAYIITRRMKHKNHEESLCWNEC